MKLLGVLLLSASCVMVSGCQAFLGSDRSDLHSAHADSSDLDLSDYFVARLQAGRVHLSLDRPTQAVVAFRQASYDPSHAGEAFNGMAIAYARLGRLDLARRYFEAAVAERPADLRYQRNLARLDAATEDNAATGDATAMAASTGSAPMRTPGPPSAQTVRSDPARPAPPSVEIATSSFTRSSRHEVHLTSRSGEGSVAGVRRGPNAIHVGGPVLATKHLQADPSRTTTLASLRGGRPSARTLRLSSHGPRH